jgi:predicted oxidoreductase
MTLGGLVVDEDTGQVLRADGSVIEGLYAAGRNAVGVCSQSYVSGLSIADCVFSGRRAGRNAVGVCSRSYVSGLSIADCVFSGRRAGRHVALLSGSGQDPDANRGCRKVWE